MEILEKLGAIQTKLKAPKNQYNKFGNYYYRNAEDIQEAVKPLLAETKTVLTISDDIVQVGDRFYIKATAQLIDIENKTDIKAIAYAREPMERKGMDDAQVTGATSSYARKYALCGLFLLDDTKDADSMDNSKDESKSKATPQKANPLKLQEKSKKGVVLTDQQKTMIITELTRTGISLKSLLENYGANALDYLTPDEAADAIATLAKKPNKGFKA